MEYIYLYKNCHKKFRFTQSKHYVLVLENVSGTLEIDLESKGVSVDILGIYTGKNKDSYELKTVQRHIAPGSRSNLWIKGIFKDRSRFRYHGLIRIEKDAHKTHAFQKNQNLLFSDWVDIVSKPDLEILADDVFCTHASTTGSISENDLFYYQTRGLNTYSATKNIMSGFLNEIFSYISDLGFSNKLQKIPTYKKYYA